MEYSNVNMCKGWERGWVEFWDKEIPLVRGVQRKPIKGSKSWFFVATTREGRIGMVEIPAMEMRNAILELGRSDVR